MDLVNPIRTLQAVTTFVNTIVAMCVGCFVHPLAARVGASAWWSVGGACVRGWVGVSVVPQRGVAARCSHLWLLGAASRHISGGRRGMGTDDRRAPSPE